MEALERVKMLPAACGEPGTRISFGKWTRRGWMGAGYLIAREVTPDFKSTVFRGRLGERPLVAGATGAASGSGLPVGTETPVQGTTS